MCTLMSRHRVELVLMSNFIAVIAINSESYFIFVSVTPSNRFVVNMPVGFRHSCFDTIPLTLHSLQ